CYRMARALFGALGMPLAESQILVDLAGVHASLADQPTAVVYYNDALLAHRRAETAAPSLAAHIRRTSTDVQLRLYSLYEHPADRAGTERVIAAVGEQLAGAELPQPGTPARTWTEIVAESGSAHEPLPDDSEQYLAAISSQFLTVTVETARVTAAC